MYILYLSPLFDFDSFQTLFHLQILSSFIWNLMLVSPFYLMSKNTLDSDTRNNSIQLKIEKDLRVPTNR